jgi:N-acetylglucosamine-6-phosphate deacetylase
MPISVEDGVCVDELSVLSGSDMAMSAAVRNATTQLGVDLADAAPLASMHPAAFLRLDHELGRIAPGYRANLVAMDEKLQVQRTLDRRHRAVTSRTCCRAYAGLT